MLNEIQKIELIEKYFQGKLTIAEQNVFEQLRETNPAFAEEVSYYEDFMMGVEAFGNQELKKHFQNLEASIVAAEATDNTSPQNDVIAHLKKQASYTLEQLKALFLPVASYQMAISSTNRSQSLAVVLPKNEIDCTDSKLYFELSAATELSLVLQIENNRQSHILKKQVDATNKKFAITLPQDLPAGIYYWKLSRKNDLLIGSFYIRKSLMPS